MQVSVIVPVYNVLPLAKECLASIFGVGSKLIFEVIVVDNGSCPDVEEWLLREEQLHPNLRHLRYSEPLGFSRAVNAGAAAATGDVLIILNSDTVVTPGWMDGLYLELLTDPTLGAITPCTNYAGDTAQVDFRTVDLSRPKALALVAEKPKLPRVRLVHQRITFFCVAICYATWCELGGLDESYGMGNFEDDDLCLRLRVAGWSLGVAEHVFVYHHHSATFQANGINHKSWMAQNAAIFANRARQFAEASPAPTLRWPKCPAPEISVVILPKSGAPLECTLVSLRNQTVRDFEIVPPDSSNAPTGVWIAYVTEGDILYPFHLETLRDALQRASAQAIFSDGWIAGGSEVLPHPDAERSSQRPFASDSLPHAPSLLSGWMHHQSMDHTRLWEQTVPVHWRSLTWEMKEAPARRLAEECRKPAWSFTKAGIEFARQCYRRTVPYETRLSIDSQIRHLLGLQRSVPQNTNSNGQHAIRSIDNSLARLVALGIDAGKFSCDCSLPDVIFFNIIPWKALTQRPHHFARALAERGHRVFWIETDLRPDANWWSGRAFEQVIPGVHLVQLPGIAEPPGRCDIYSLSWNPVLLDAMFNALVQLASAYGIRQAVSVVHFPRWEPLVLRMQQRLGWSVIYDCLDDQRAFAKLFQTQVRDHERQLVEKADCHITSSEALQNRLLKRFGQRPWILLPNAVDYDLFAACSSAGYLRHLVRPIVGFFGALADWLDMELIRSIAARLPLWSFVYIGPQSFSGPRAESRWRECTGAPNITVLGQMSPQTLGTFLADFDVCTMPFLDVAITQPMHAVKIYEYLAAGKPVVSRDLPEVRNLIGGPADARDLIALYSTPDEFYSQLQAAVAGDNPDLVQRRKNFARQHDWSARADLLAAEIRGLSKARAYETSSLNAISNGSKTRSQE